ncbi:MAG: polyprenol phosphomannose-dependent alpha 1,6 mannosyltransferase MptB [Actinomycetota bacterium]
MGLLPIGYLLLALIGGAPASPLVPPLPPGVQVPSWAARGAELIGIDALGWAALTFLSLSVMLTLLGAFAVLIVEAWRGRVRLGPVRFAAGISLVVAVAAPLLLSRDVYSYAAYGRMFALYDSNPYLHPPSDFPADPFVRVTSTAWLDTRSVYGPAFTVAGAGVARAWAGSPAGTILGFKVLAALAVALTGLLVTVAARRLRPGREAMAAIAVGLNPVIVVHAVGGGHNDALVAALIAGALVLAAPRGLTTDRLERSGVAPSMLGATALLTTGSLIKVVAALPLLFWVFSLVRTSRSGDRFRVLGAHALVAGLVAVAFIAPFAEGWRSLSSMTTLASLEGWASGPALLARGARTLGRALAGTGLGDAMAKAVSGAFLGAVAYVLWPILRRARPYATRRAGLDQDPVDGVYTPAVMWGASLLMLSLGAPYLLPWYAAWFIPLLPLASDDRLAIIGLAAAGLLAVTGIPAEPGPAPGLWEGMKLAVHYVAAPVMLVLFAAAAARVRSLARTSRPPAPLTPTAPPLER